jgi:vancomycin resistance protein VanJ
MSSKIGRCVEGATSPSPKPRLIWRLLLTVCDLYTGALVVYFVLRLRSSSNPWPVALTGQFLHLLLIPAFPLLVIMLLLRRWRRSVMAGVGVIAFVWLFGGLFLPKSSPRLDCTNPAGGCRRLTVMTYNVGSGLAEPDGLVEMLRASDADIIGLQELSEEQATVLERELQDEYPYRALYGLGFKGVGLLSRYPIQELLFRRRGTMPYLVAALDVGGSPLTVIVYHLKPPVLVVDGFKSRYIQRNTGSDLILTAVEHAPAIVLLDFSTGDQSENYAQLRRAGLRDVFREAGYGLGPTFPACHGGWRNLAAFPLVRIDYVFVTEELDATRAWVGPNAGSDHLPVLAELFWVQERRE